MSKHMAYFRSELDALDYPWIDQISDAELSTWFFQPGPARYKVLEWILCQIDPATQEHFYRARSQDIEKVTLKLLVDYGLCRSSDKNVVLGSAPEEAQMLLWKKLFYQCNILKKYEKKNLHNCLPNHLKFVSAVYKNSNLWDLLEAKPKFHSDAYVTPFVETFDDLLKQLKEAEEDLREVSDATEASEKSSEHKHFSESSSLPSSRSCTPGAAHTINDRGEHVAVLGSKLDDCYKKIMQQLIPAVQKRPADPTAARLAGMVENLAPKLNAYAQFVKDRVEVKTLTTSFIGKPMPANIRNSENTLHDFVSSLLNDVSGIVTLLRTNQDFLNFRG